MLDPILADLIHQLTDAFLSYCQSHVEDYSTNSKTDIVTIEPLPRSICQLLYVFCKVRGYKVVVRLLNNEPRYIEPILVCFQKWSLATAPRFALSWEERYIMLLWLSHLMLAPFELSTVSGVSTDDSTSLPEALLHLNLPEVVRSLLSVAFRYLCVASKDREAASTLIVRISLREDMKRLHLPQAMVNWCTNQLRDDSIQAVQDQYRYVGLLTLLYGMSNSASSSEAASFLDPMLETCTHIANDSSQLAVTTRQFAPSRKLLIKILRSGMLHTIALSSVPAYGNIENADTILESGIQILLEWLSDSDTPVRQAASKALGIVILKLESNLAAEVIEAVLGCLNENMLLENLQTGELLVATDHMNIDLQQYKKNVNAVDPLKWNGAMLTLGHVLFRRSPPVQQLSSILEALLTGLAFEQRSNVGTSMGVAVRDAACFGIWSLARKYSTKEVETTTLSRSFGGSYPEAPQSTLQKIANHLVVASCLDPSGNLRRGASAALQELIGRHPDTIREGIFVVQRVDYHAVARRSRAISEVAEAVSELDPVYHASILDSLLGWRGCRAVDADSRRQAAATIGILLSKAAHNLQMAFSKHLVTQILRLKPGNVGVNAATRHGLLLALTAILGIGDIADEAVLDSLAVLRPVVLDLDNTTGLLSGRINTDMAYVLESTARLIAASATQLAKTSELAIRDKYISSAGSVLDRCTTATEIDTVSSVAAQANVGLFALLDEHPRAAFMQSWLPKELPKQKGVFTCKGRIESMSLLYPLLVSTRTTAHVAEAIPIFLTQIITSELNIDIKVNAMAGISSILGSQATIGTRSMLLLGNAVLAGLSDYTSDQRGDVGSLLRLCSIDAVLHFQQNGLNLDQDIQFMQAVARLSVEKLTKVRFAAWNCLKQFWEAHLPKLEIHNHFDHQADISSFAYYRQLTDLFTIPWLRGHVLQGLLSAISGGTDDASQVASEALVSFLIDRQGSDVEEQVTYLIDTILQWLRLAVHREDREIVPMLDMLCLVLEQFIRETEAYMTAQKLRVLELLNDLQTPIADIPRIQALVRLLSDLALMEAYHLESADRISRKLLHKWPKVRQASADAVFLLDESCVPYDTVWNAAATANKDKVVAIRKVLGVAGRNNLKK